MKQTEKVQRWLNGPHFLHEKVESHSRADEVPDVPDDDPEVVKRVNVCEIVEKYDVLSRIEERISRWLKMKRVMAMIMLFIKKLKKTKDVSEPEHLSVTDIQEAELCILKMVQKRTFKNEISEIGKIKEVGKKATRSAQKSVKKQKKRASELWKLDPFVDEKGLVRVGGRLRSLKADSTYTFPVILPRKAVVSRRIVEHYHAVIQHCGRTSTINEVRTNGYWVVGISSNVRTVIHNCIRCRILRGLTGTQKMSDLPTERVSPEAPFTYTGVDMFGYFLIKEGRKELKRYCALFTCLSSRAVHIEVTTSMDTDSFILALRRFMDRRGPVRLMKSDNGGNFIGAENELKEAWKEMDHERISNFLTSNNCDWIDQIEWSRIAPTASHMGGSWERQIGTVKRILSAMLKDAARPLDNESFETLMTEVEAIVNSRPLTLIDINDPESQPLTPSNLLTMKSKVVMPPPGTFQKSDAYCRKRWRYIQHMSNVFWERWRKEYLLSLQSRSKWTAAKRNFIVGDVVLLKDEECTRNKWPLGVITETFPSNDGLVRSVNVKTSNGSLLKRPITKLVLLIESENAA